MYHTCKYKRYGGVKLQKNQTKQFRMFNGTDHCRSRTSYMSKQMCQKRIL